MLSGSKRPVDEVRGKIPILLCGYRRRLRSGDRGDELDELVKIGDVQPDTCESLHKKSA